MKRILALLLTLFMLACAVPAVAFNTQSTVQRTTLLDLTGYASATDSSREGWSFDPNANNGDPVLTLNSYGSADAHSAPILCPINTTVIVNGQCYIDNALMGEDYDLLTGDPDGYLTIEGHGTLNLYADQYHGKGVNIALGGDGKGDEDILVMSDVTVNYYGMERTPHTAFYLRPAIYAFESIAMTNVTFNMYEGGYAVWLVGHETIGAPLTELTASNLLIDGCTINVQSVTGDNWGYAKGIYTTFGNIRIKDSHVNIEAGSGSLYAYKTIFIEGSSYVDVVSTPLSSADYCTLVYCNKLAILNGVERVHFLSKRNISGGSVFHIKEDYSSVLGDELTVTIGSFENGTYYTGHNAEYPNRPEFEVVGGYVQPTYYTVNFYDYDGTLLDSQQVEEGQAAVAPEAPYHYGRLFMYWSADYSCITSDLDVTAVYALLGDADCNGRVNFADVTLINQYILGNATLSEQGMINADFDLNGFINFADISSVYQMVIGASN